MGATFLGAVPWNTSLRRLFDCARLDEVMRVFFPLAYFLYMGIMYAVLPLYPHNEGCIGI
ncbi:hypothetical protein EMIHUDRAFT_254544 [Emiliania huxleyi CCMP1516]|uniref:ABC-2 type transporter domain-containing protein n=2 Tax=Emiliania huxleyi TaxID=2903 RepID=A0A0D3JQW7_EMIH1|nr:hypothetical protein EMIHUDRAFT_254544 [Emiliania huxleyi CCMP1516]EOD25902.1 hypothetical protein EMIHUDRAFT_254544 [Emiliania huxleyi CCMP1516]|eukprot:XP_005778331.1 hypothetical protein EMIHUDRAFT_254544 [Emiliania huxleyi CCMP1516]